jgi:hypothetical protein
MGLHANIHQFGREVSISLQGNFRAPEATQLQAILVHFHSRGCRSFVLDLSGMAPLNAKAQASLQKLIGQPQSPTHSIMQGSAIRLLADSPAVQPQTDCGGLSIFAA